MLEHAPLCLTINIIINIGPVSLRRGLHGGVYDRLLVSQPMSWPRLTCKSGLSHEFGRIIRRR